MKKKTIKTIIEISRVVVAALAGAFAGEYSDTIMQIFNFIASLF